MTRRRLVLTALAVVLAGADARWLFRRATAANATITYVGLDSVDVAIPARATAPAWRRGRWERDPQSAFDALAPHPERKPSTDAPAFVSLAPEGDYGRAIAVFRDLKRRRLCHIIVQENQVEPPFTADTGERLVGIPAYILCGHSLGDGNYIDTIPADRAIHLD